MPSAKANRTSEMPEKRLEVLPLNATERPGVISLLVWAGCVYLLLLPVADVLIRLDWQAGAELSWVRGRFTAVNAITLTGFTGSIPLAKFPAGALRAIFVLTFVGAVFPMIFGGVAGGGIFKMPYSGRREGVSSVVFFFGRVGGGTI